MSGNKIGYLVSLAFDAPNREEADRLVRRLMLAVDDLPTLEFETTIVAPGGPPFRRLWVFCGHRTTNGGRCRPPARHAGAHSPVWPDDSDT